MIITGLFQPGKRLFLVAKTDIDERKVYWHHVAMPRKLSQSVKVLLRPSMLTGCCMTIAEACQRFRVVVESSGRFKLGDGVSKTTSEEVDPAEETMRDPVRWICLDRFAELGSGVFVLTCKEEPVASDGCADIDRKRIQILPRRSSAIASVCFPMHARHSPYHWCVRA